MRDIFYGLKKIRTLTIFKFANFIIEQQCFVTYATCGLSISNSCTNIITIKCDDKKCHNSIVKVY